MEFWKIYFFVLLNICYKFVLDKQVGIKKKEFCFSYKNVNLNQSSFYIFYILLLKIINVRNIQNI